MITPDIVDRLRSIVGDAFVRTDENARRDYGVDALKRGAMADVVVFPITTAEIAAIARLCNETRTPLVPRGGGTGFTGGAVPVRGGVVLSLERMNRILEIDPIDLVAVVEPNVITGDLQDAVEASACSIRPILPACGCRRSAAMSPSARVARARSNTA